MAFKSIQLPPGIERNATPYDTPNRYWDMNLVRWQSGTLRPVGGWQRLTTTELSTPARMIYMYRDNSNVRNVVIGAENKLYSFNTSQLNDITPASFVPLTSIGTFGGYGTFEYGFDPAPVPDDPGPPLVEGTGVYGRPRNRKTVIDAPIPFWSVSNWGEDLIICARSDGRLFYYDTATPTVAPAAITDGLSPPLVPTGNTSVVVTDERHVMAIGCGGNPRRVGWSSREDYEDWDFASTTNTAGFLDLDARTPLLKGVRVREGVLIYSGSECYLARYVGQPFIYGIDRIGDSTVLSPMAIAAYNGKSAWMGKNEFWRYEGGFVTTLECPVLNDVYKDIDPEYGQYRAFASVNGTFPEIWFFYPSVGSEECDRYVAWNYSENFWFWGSMSRTAMVGGETYNRPWMTGTDKFLYEHENGFTNAGLTRVGQIYAETGVLPFMGDDMGAVITSAMPATGYGYDSIRISFKGRQTPESSETTFGPYYPRTNGYMDTRVNARDIRIRFEATSDGDWSVGNCRFDIKRGTRR